jgi:deazaflavin-dependent oxidoreductase (nitroreductase family)
VSERHSAEPSSEIDLSLIGDEHVRRYRETDGAVGGVWNGAPCLVLTTRGRHTGEPRETALICGFDGDAFVIIASVGGAPKHPAWYLNLVADPSVEVQYLADRFAAVARPVEGEERDRLWKFMTATWPRYDDYQRRTERRIPVVRLERA